MTRTCKECKSPFTIGKRRAGTCPRCMYLRTKARIAKNPDYWKKYYAKHRAWYREKGRRDYQRRRVKHLDKAKAYADAHREQIRANYKKWFQRNRARELKRIKEWKKRNPSRLKAYRTKLRKLLVMTRQPHDLQQKMLIEKVVGARPKMAFMAIAGAIKSHGTRKQN